MTHNRALCGVDPIHVDKLISELPDGYLEYYETYIPQFCPHPNKVRFFFDVYDDEEGRL